MTHFYHLEPHDPIVLGDGRSIGANTMTGSVDLPYPSTLAGLMRTTLGRKPDGTFDSSRIPDLLNQSLVGPLLARLDPDPELFVPAPADALFLGSSDPSDKSLFRRRLTPQPLRDQEASDLDATGLLPVGLSSELLDKPKAGPRYWRWTHFERWLYGPNKVKDGENVVPEDLGLARLDHEERIHVALDPKTRTVIDGAIFRTDGVRYTHKAEKRLERFGLHFGWQGDKNGVKAATVGLGGERRLSALAPTPSSIPGLPTDLIKLIEKSRRVRLILLTPAIFDQGFRPATFTEAKLVACSVGRAVVVSGWDHNRTPSHPHGKPKPSRRCAPAGSVYWLDLDQRVDVKSWVERHWFKNVSSDEQDRRDGFGLAVVGSGGEV